VSVKPGLTRSLKSVPCCRWLRTTRKALPWLHWPVSFLVSKVLVNTTQGYIARQVLKLDMEYGNANNNKNLNKDENVEIIESPYFQLTGPLSSAGTFNGWILQGRDHSLNFVLRQALRMKNWYHGDSNSEVFAGTVRYGLGLDDFRGHVGSPGN